MKQIVLLSVINHDYRSTLSQGRWNGCFECVESPFLEV